ncbi:uncharacterized protein LOC123319262 [Coccinella septempunctata]|uniref:uncharacterized protein LOC123319262 n=1 Tax=Coccinella septempunctata TaxID=41139 RepID=UPI001D06E10C|nr:uncharacterized protein LOC123319262 [Coccinella septempunctata]
MFFVKCFLFFVIFKLLLLTVLSSRNCAEENGLDSDVFQKLHDKTYMNPSQAELCALKCMYEKGETLDSEGYATTKFQGAIDGSRKLTNTQKEEFKQCITQATPVKKCHDVAAFTHCIFKYLMG